MSTEPKNRHPEVDAEARKIVGKDLPDTSFEYHVVRLVLLIEREVHDKEAIEEMTDEVILAIRDLRTWFHRL